MRNEHDMELAGLFDDIKEPSYSDDFTKKVAGRIEAARRFRFVLKLSLAVFGILVFADIAPWLMQQTGSIISMTDSLARGVTLLCLSPIGWATGGIIVLYSLLKAR